MQRKQEAMTQKIGMVTAMKTKPQYRKRTVTETRSRIFCLRTYSNWSIVVNDGVQFLFISSAALLLTDMPFQAHRSKLFVFLCAGLIFINNDGTEAAAISIVNSQTGKVTSLWVSSQPLNNSQQHIKTNPLATLGKTRQIFRFTIDFESWDWGNTLQVLTAKIH